MILGLRIPCVCPILNSSVGKARRAPRPERGTLMSNDLNAIFELRELAESGAITLVERDVLCDLVGLAGDEAVYVSMRDVDIIRSIIRKLNKVPCISRLSLTVETSEYCGASYVTVTDGEGEDSETYASGTVDYVDGFMSAMRVAFTRISRAWYARGLM